MIGKLIGLAIFIVIVAAVTGTSLVPYYNDAVQVRTVAEPIVDHLVTSGLTAAANSHLNSTFTPAVNHLVSTGLSTLGSSYSNYLSGLK